MNLFAYECVQRVQPWRCHGFSYMYVFFVYVFIKYEHNLNVLACVE